MKKLAFLVPAALLASAAGLVRTHVPLVGNGKVLKWSNPGNVGIVINSTGSDDILDGSHETALRLAIQDWNRINGTTLQLIEDTTPSQQARTDWTSSGIHLIWFDETNSSGYFPFGSGTVAITPIWFMGNGDITDADILFNGSGFSFTTSGEVGHFDVGDVGTHELGHLVGLDHTGWAGGTMYPYVDPLVILHRSISADEARGMRHSYPQGTFGRITGTIRRLADNSAVAGAHVVARDVVSGRTSGSILTAGNGTFTIQGLDAGTYDVFVVPLGNGGFGDAPVDSSNIQGYAIETDFRTTFYGTTATITGTESIAMGTLLVGADVSFNLGTNIDRYPIRVVDGTSQTIVLRGSGLNNGSTLEVGDPDLLVGTPMWFGTSVSFQLTVPDGELPGHVDVMATNVSGHQSVLVGGLEVTPPSPTVTGVNPPTGPIAGGTALTITGTDFEPGARIVVGDRIYEDGVAGTTVVDPTTITLTTTATLAGTHDVVVIDRTGVEGRDANAFTVLAMPVIDSVFPLAGFAGGGTDVVLTGVDFLDGASVRIDGVDQGVVTVTGTTQLSFTTLPGVAGGQLLEVENPGGAIATSAFTYMGQPDPALISVDPSTAKIGGGQTIAIGGTNFTPTTLVEFGADPATGTGGLAAASITFVDSSTLEVETPAFAQPGPTSVLVREQATAQAHVLAAALSVKKDSSGGGGCTMVPVSDGPSPRSIVAGGWWMLVLLLITGIRAGRSAPECA